MPEFAAGLVVLALIGVGLAWRAERARRKAASERYAGVWETAEKAEAGVTIVGVRRVSHGRETDFAEVARVPNDDPDWLRKVRDARAEAAERISTLAADV